MRDCELSGVSGTDDGPIGLIGARPAVPLIEAVPLIDGGTVRPPGR